MNERTLELLLEMTDTYADRLDDVALEEVDSSFADYDYHAGVTLLIGSLTTADAVITVEELEDLQLLCDSLGLESDLLNPLEVV